MAETSQSDYYKCFQKAPELPGEPRPRAWGAWSLQLGGNAHTGPPTEAPSRRGKKKKTERKFAVQARLFFRASPASALCIRQIHNWEQERERGGKRESGNQRALSRGGGWGGQERRRAAEERGQAEGGRIRVGVVKKKSKGEVMGWEGKRGRESTQTATLIQDHWQLYFKGNSQNCDTALHNCREPILFLDTMPKMIKGMVRKGPHLNKRSQRKMPLLSGVPLHTSTKTHHSPNKSFTTLHNQVRSIWSNSDAHDSASSVTHASQQQGFSSVCHL